VSRQLNGQDFVETISKEQIDKHGYSNVKPEVQSGLEDDLMKVSDEVVGFLNRRYPISLNLLRKIFSLG